MAKTRSQEIAPDAPVHYDPPRKHRRPPKKSMQPPLTPMIDVTFQLLLFFLLTMQFREEEGRVPGTLPPIGEGAGATVTEEVKLVIRRTPDGANFFVGRGVGLSSPQQLFQQLQATRQKLSSDVPLVIEPEYRVPWEYVVEAFSQAVKARFEKIGFGPVSRGAG